MPVFKCPFFFFLNTPFRSSVLCMSCWNLKFSRITRWLNYPQFHIYYVYYSNAFYHVSWEFGYTKYLIFIYPPRDCCFPKLTTILLKLHQSIFFEVFLWLLSCICHISCHCMYTFWPLCTYGCHFIGNLFSWNQMISIAV